MPKRTTTLQNPPNQPLSFGARLRQERERRKVSIASIAESTKILGALLEGLENDDVSRWPIGFYRRAFIRAYATSISLDPEAVLREFNEKFPEPVEVLPVPPTAGLDRRARFRLKLSEQVSWFVGGRLRDLLPPRVNAVAFDLAVLGAAGLCLFVVMGAFWAPLSLSALVYYCGAILILGNTPGVCLFAPSDRQPSDHRDSSSEERYAAATGGAASS